MKKITQAEILAAAAELVVNNGLDNVTLSQVGKQLGISHAALYKHFKNKQDLWTSLAMNWLDDVLVEIFPFKVTSEMTQSEIAHDWLWALAKGKMRAHAENPQMFELYTDYIDNDEHVLMLHTQDLIRSLQSALGTTDTVHVAALIQAFTVFSAPGFANFWNEDSRSQFEAIWELMQPGVAQLLK